MLTKLEELESNARCLTSVKASLEYVLAEVVDLKKDNDNEKE